MRVACVGGGPAGLFVTGLLRRARPDAEVVLFERLPAGAVAGFGVVFAEPTMRWLAATDPALHAGVRAAGRGWDEIEMQTADGVFRCGGHPMTAVGRAKLLQILRGGARDAGVELRYGHPVDDLAELAGFDFVVLADGGRSRLRDRRPHVFRPYADAAESHYLWLGTGRRFPRMTFSLRHTEFGVFGVHAYPHGPDRSTFIVEAGRHTLAAAGLAAEPDLARSRALLEQAFADQLDGHPLIDGNARWERFATRRLARWHDGRTVVIGDAAHTTHFSVGAGTRMALEDAARLVEALQSHDFEPAAAFDAYETGRRADVERIQAVAEPSRLWWDRFAWYQAALPGAQLAFHFFTRALAADRLSRRDARYVDSVRDWWLARHGAEPLDSPLDLAGVTVRGRLATAGPSGPAGRWWLHASGADLPLLVAPAGRPAGGGPFGLLVSADEPTAAEKTIAAAPEVGADLVAITGGTAAQRQAFAELARLRHRVPAAVIGEYDDAAATALVLSGRADLVAAPLP